MPAIKAIDEERRLLDLSQRDLCAAARVNVSTYSRIKGGRCSGTERTFVRLRNALAIARQRQAAE